MSSLSMESPRGGESCQPLQSPRFGPLEVTAGEVEKAAEGGLE